MGPRGALVQGRGDSSESPHCPPDTHLSHGQGNSAAGGWEESHGERQVCTPVLPACGFAAR